MTEAVICGHCQKAQRGHAIAADGTPLCHPLGVFEDPNTPPPPDCYHLVTVYRHPRPCPDCPGGVSVDDVMATATLVMTDTPSLDALAAAVDCDTAETVRWEIAETLDKCAGTKERLLEQMRAGEDCDTCPPGFLAVVMQAENLARALGIALDLLHVPAVDVEAAALEGAGE